MKLLFAFGLGCLLFAVSAAAFPIWGGGSDDLIMVPPSSATGKPALAVIMLAGYGIEGSAYKPLAQQWQEQLSNDFAVYVAAPHFPMDVPFIDAQGAVQRVADSLVKEGLPADHKLLFAAHSAGSVMAIKFLSDGTLPSGVSKPSGLVLMGSFLPRSFRSADDWNVGPGQYSFPVPVLTIGGELDGLCRITRIAEARHTQIDMALDVEKASQFFPVTVVEGMSHMQFASGTPPSLVKKRDFKPEISNEAAWEAAGADFAAFARSIVGADKQAGLSALSSRMEQSLSLLSPIIDALNLEGYYHFKVPCYNETNDEYGGITYSPVPFQPGCTANSPWTQTAQTIMGQHDGLQIFVRDSQHPVWQEKPACHLPLIHSGMDRNTGLKTHNPDPTLNPGNDEGVLCDNVSDCSLNVTTVTQVVYNTAESVQEWKDLPFASSLDTGFYPISAQELRSKMKSRQALWQAANESTSHEKDALDKLDQPPAGRCAEINQEAIRVGLSMVPEATRKRYESIGQQMVVAKEDKHVCIAGPCWIWAPLVYTDNGASGMEVLAPSFAESNKNPWKCGEKFTKYHGLPCPAGMHYCKLVSPARVVEWVYVDSLRLNGGIHG